MKSKQISEGSLEIYVHHKKSTTKLLQNFGDAKRFVPGNSEGDSEYKSYTYIQSEYVGNLTMTKLLETRVIYYDIMAPFIIPYLLCEYTLEVEYLWGDCSDTAVDLFKHWYNISLQQAILFQRDSCMYVCTDLWPRIACPNYEVVGFQPQTLAIP